MLSVKQVSTFKHKKMRKSLLYSMDDIFCKKKKKIRRSILDVQRMGIKISFYSLELLTHMPNKENNNSPTTVLYVILFFTRFWRVLAKMSN